MSKLIAPLIAGLFSASTFAAIAPSAAAIEHSVPVLSVASAAVAQPAAAQEAQMLAKKKKKAKKAAS